MAPPPAASEASNGHSAPKDMQNGNNSPDTAPQDEDFDKLLQGNNIDAIISADLSGKDKIKHADDALDFESEDELAEEEEDDAEGPGAGQSQAGDANAKESGENDENDDWTNEFAKDLGILDDAEGNVDANANGDSAIMDDKEAEMQAEEARRKFEKEEKEMELAQLQEWYPGFEPHIVLKMNKMFGPEASQTQPQHPKNIMPLPVTRMRLEVDPEQKNLFLNDDLAAKRAINNNFGLHRGRVEEITPASVLKIESEIGRKLAVRPPGCAELERKDTVEERSPSTANEGLQLEVSNWEDALNAGESSDSKSNTSPAPQTPTDLVKIERMHFDNGEIYDSEFEDELLLGQVPIKRPKLDLNDSQMLFVEDKQKVQGKQNPINDLRGNFEQQLNISNDRAYDMLRANYQRKVRSTIGSLNIDHSMVALRLQSPFYRVQLTKPQMRAWQRQRFNIKPGTTLQFSSLKNRKKRKDKSKTAQEVFSTSADLSLGDSAPVFLVEYSEETPLVLNGFGMGSKLINYYRKKSEDDKYRPKMPLGETHVLDVQDRSAFWNFGFIEPGMVVPTLYNQMARAPMFQHPSKPTDFLLIKSTSRARGIKYFLKEIPFQFTCGQEFPAVPIPGPHSRKKTTASKNRLKMIAYRALNKDPNQRLQVKDISAYFPEFNEVQNRQRLKDFMVYQRSGDDQGFWKIKPGDELPNEEQIRNMISPEDVMLLESMFVGEQHLKDSGYSKQVDEEEDDNDEGASIEEQLAPWNISRNFINAIQGKAMLQLNGIGDPTARGEGFSFLRTSMKGGFATEVSLEDEKKLNGHSYNVALQQKAYDEEIRRIWYAQKRSLSVNDPTRLPEFNKPYDAGQFGNGGGIIGSKSGADTPSVQANDKVLQITRVVRDQNDVLVRDTELITDPQVIRAYLRQRKAREEEKMAVDRIAVSDDAEVNKSSQKFLEQELARLNRNADRRKARKATKQDAKLKSTTRKCATCGMVGHIKTNKSCPMYNDIFMNAKSSTPAGSPPP